ncbi:MAG: 30S ribosome-binding factor RbfA [Firmicutes bacterium]|jgi:ribosome-binding factor A|nr:30S ribosome-binding factor RbfA [Bacillota bacterium]
MASEQRRARLCQEIKRSASEIIKLMKDPRLGFVTVTDAEITRDLSYARVYVSVLGDDARAEETLAALKSATGFFRSELGQRIRLRHTPEVSFHLDKSAQRGARINEILAELRQKEESDTHD